MCQVWLSLFFFFSLSFSITFFYEQLVWLSISTSELMTKCDEWRSRSSRLSLSLFYFFNIFSLSLWKRKNVTKMWKKEEKNLRKNIYIFKFFVLIKNALPFLHFTPSIPLCSLYYNFFFSLSFFLTIIFSF